MSEDGQRRILRLLVIEKEQRRSHKSLKKWATENFAILGHWKRAAEIKERAAENFSVLKSAPAKACSKKCTAGSNVNWVSHFFNWLTLKLQDLQLVILSRRALTRMMMTASMLIYRRLWWRSEQVGNMLAQCILSVPAELAFYDAPHHPPFYFVIQQFAQLTYNYDFLAAGQGWY